jgi:phenylpropionate dioxygenase-like ring-hydroxylating dioxygenase large terminal subunit
VDTSWPFQIGDYRPASGKRGAGAGPHAKGEIELISNVCRHRQAVMLKGRGNRCPRARAMPGGNIVCPLHRWTYSTSGELLGAPHFSHDPCLNLNNYRCASGTDCCSRTTAATSRPTWPAWAARAARLHGFVLDHVEMHECNYNWKTFIEVYLEDYHVGPFHPGLGNFVTCDDLKWEFASSTRCRPWAWPTASATPARTSTSAGTRCCWYRNGEPPERGAIWLTYYPTSWSSGIRMC